MVKLKRIVLLSLVVAMVIPLFSPMLPTASAVTSKDAKLKDRIQAYLYYHSMLACAKKAALKDVKVMSFNGQNVSPQHAESGEWFGAGNEQVHSSNGKSAPCSETDWTGGLTQFFNFKAGSEALKAMGFKSQEGDYVPSGNMAGDINAGLNQAWSGGVGESISMGAPEWYIHLRTIFFGACSPHQTTNATGELDVDVPEPNADFKGKKNVKYTIGNNADVAVQNEPNGDVKELSCKDVAKQMGDFIDGFNTWAQAHPDEAKEAYGGASAGSINGESGAAGEASSTEGKSSCTVKGIGWIVCPVVRFLSEIADQMYAIVSNQFLAINVDILSEKDGKNNLMTAWSAMRNIANVCFVIAFLVIIYSQVTSIGISNYNIKRMLPKLIVSVILVNSSLWICAIAVDLSNFLGYSMKSLLDVSATSLAGAGSATSSADGTLWTALAAAALVAGAAGALMTGMVSLAMLLPILLGGVSAVLLALILLTMRQALIIILIIISPLAFVAYLLPNTEDLFKKWYKLFKQLLLLFPVIAVIFGGSKLAGSLIMSSANGDFFTQLVGAGVTLIPLFTIPVVMKVANNMMGTVGAMVTGSRAANWANTRAREHGGTLGERMDGRLRESHKNNTSTFGRKFGGITRMRAERSATNTVRMQRYKAADESYENKFLAKSYQSGTGSTHDNLQKAAMYSTTAKAAGSALNSSLSTNLANKSSTINQDMRSSLGGITGATAILDQQAAAEIGKQIKEAMEGMDMLSPEEVAQEFAEAVKSGDEARISAAMQTAGKSTAGKESLGKAIDSLTNEGHLDNGSKVRNYVNSVGNSKMGDVKSSDAAMHAFFNQAPTDTNTKMISELSKEQSTYSNLTDSQMAGQSAERLAQAGAAGAITSEQASHLMTTRAAENVTKGKAKSVLSDIANNNRTALREADAKTQRDLADFHENVLNKPEKKGEQTHL